MHGFILLFFICSCFISLLYWVNVPYKIGTKLKRKGIPKWEKPSYIEIIDYDKKSGYYKVKYPSCNIVRNVKYLDIKDFYEKEET